MDARTASRRSLSPPGGPDRCTRLACSGSASPDFISPSPRQDRAPVRHRRAAGYRGGHGERAEARTFHQRPHAIPAASQGVCRPTQRRRCRLQCGQATGARNPGRPMLVASQRFDHGFHPEPAPASLGRCGAIGVSARKRIVDASTWGEPSPTIDALRVPPSQSCEPGDGRLQASPRPDESSRWTTATRTRC
jgi:hypothetical protein